MKKVEAYVKPHKLNDVTMALRSIRGLSGATVFEVRGWGRAKQQVVADRHASAVPVRRRSPARGGPLLSPRC